MSSCYELYDDAKANIEAQKYETDLKARTLLKYDTNNCCNDENCLSLLADLSNATKKCRQVYKYNQSDVCYNLEKHKHTIENKLRPKSPNKMANIVTIKRKREKTTSLSPFRPKSPNRTANIVTIKRKKRAKISPFRAPGNIVTIKRKRKRTSSMSPFTLSKKTGGKIR